MAERLQNPYKYRVDANGVFLLEPNDEWPYEKYSGMTVQEVVTNKHDAQYTIWMYRKHLHHGNIQRKFRLSRESYNLMADTLGWKRADSKGKEKEVAQEPTRARKPIEINSKYEIKRKIIQGKAISIT